MIGSYIVFRCIDLFCASQSRFSSQGARVVAILAAMLCLAVTVFFMIDLVLSPGALPKVAP